MINAAVKEHIEAIDKDINDIIRRLDLLSSGNLTTTQRQCDAVRGATDNIEVLRCIWQNCKDLRGWEIGELKKAFGEGKVK